MKPADSADGAKRLQPVPLTRPPPAENLCKPALQRIAYILKLVALFGDRDPDKNLFFGLFSAWKETSPEGLLDELSKEKVGLNAWLSANRERSRFLDAARITVKFLAVAAHHAEAGRALQAWRYVAEAEYYNGASWGLFMAGCHDSPEAMAVADRAIRKWVSAQNKRAAAGLHKEHHALREEALAHFAEHRASYRSKDEAAAQIAEKVVPAKFATVRRWLRGV